MSQTPITVTYDIKELFTNLERKIDDRFNKIDDRLEKLENGQAEIKVKLATIEVQVKTIEEDVKDLKEKVKEIDTLKEGISSLQGINSFIKPVIIGLVSAIAVVVIRAIPYKF